MYSYIVRVAKECHGEGTDRQGEMRAVSTAIPCTAPMSKARQRGTTRAANRSLSTVPTRNIQHSVLALKHL